MKSVTKLIILTNKFLLKNTLKVLKEPVMKMNLIITLNKSKKTLLRKGLIVLI